MQTVLMFTQAYKWKLRL